MKNLIILFVIVSSQISFAQQKLLTLQEAVSGGFTTLAPKGVEQFQWIPKSNKFSMVVSDSGVKKLQVMEMESTKNGLIRVITLEELQEVVLFQIDRKLPHKPLEALPSVIWMDAYTFRFLHDSVWFAYNYGDKKARFLCYYNPKEMEHAEMEATNFKIAYIKGDNLHVNLKYSDETRQLTQDGGKGIVYGQAVHRNEFGIEKGLFWSPLGNKLAFYRMDETMVSEYPLYKLEDRPATAIMIRYPIAGSKSHHVTVGVHNVATNKTIYLQTGEPKEQYLTNISWSPDEKYVFIAVVNRAQNHMWLNQYDAETGAFVKTLFEETHPKYVEPENGMIFLKSKPDQFLWFSERDGYNHLYLYDLTGKLIKQVTKGPWVVTSLVGTGDNDEELFVMTTAISPLERHLYCVKMKSGKIEKLTQEAGVHNIRANDECEFFYDDFNNASLPRKVQLIDDDGGLLQILAQPESTLKDYQLGETNTGTLKADDGTDLYYRIYKPINFDVNKKYPVIVYLYNGPHLQLVTNNWQGGGNLWYHYMAQKGFIVFILDGRGSSNRGLDFENAVHRQMGTIEIRDQLVGANWLKQQTWVDSSRMGIHGWSYGGFMTTSMMTRAPGVFKAGVAGGPVIDWGLYEIMYTERYMDTPEENPEGYKTANLINHIENLKGKLLIIHGAQDDVVLWQHTLWYQQEAIKKGKQVEYFVYPQHPHNVRGKDRIHLMEMISNYFIENL